MSVPAELSIRRDEPLAARTTLGLGGRAELFLEAHDDRMLVDALAWARRAAVRVTILGGGSNTIVPDEGVAGLVVVPAMRGLERTSEGDETRVHARAGEPWDALVGAMVAEGLAGIECLAGIPGSTGATPIQNVGAYGVEVGDVLERVLVLDRTTLEPATLSRAACELAYRDSRLKRDPTRFVVLGVELRLRRGAPERPRYAELERALASLESRAGGERAPTLAEVRDTVLRLRRLKSMVLDPSDPNARSAGSFFTNPIVDSAVADAVVRVALAQGIVTDAAAVPRWEQPDGRVKLAAGWLIERSGVAKGERHGPHGHVGVSSVHALALVHHGGGTSAELLALGASVASRVKSHFGVVLEREPVLLGA